MGDVKKIIEEKNELVIKMTFSNDEKEVKELTKKIKTIEKEKVEMNEDKKRGRERGV